MAINQSTSSTLSTVTSIALHSAALLICSGYTLYQLLCEQWLLAFATGTASISLICILTTLCRRKSVIGLYYILFSALFTALTLSSYRFGLAGLALVYPLCAALFYILDYRRAFYASLAIVVITLAAALNSVAPHLHLLVSIALITTIIFSAAFSYVVDKQQNALLFDANYDYLTGTTNRRGFSTWLIATLIKLQKNNLDLALFFIDLDGFKNVNDSFGHNTGDKLLQAFAARICQSLRSHDLVHASGQGANNQITNIARLSGDEFALSIPDISSTDVAQTIAMRLIDVAAEPFMLDGNETRISISIGIGFASRAHFDFEALLANTDAALNEAKRMGKSGFRFFDDALAQQLEEQRQIEHGLRKAIEEDLFHLVFQPIYHCHSLSVAGVEVLIRCDAPVLSGIYPDKFIPAAEALGLIRDIDLWVIRDILQKIHNLPASSPLRDIVYSINISALELHNVLFPKKLEELLKRYNVDAAKIQLEITETSVIAHDERCMAVMESLNKLGIKLALDDFGMGYTAFNQLRRYPVHNLKIDRSFIWNITAEDDHEIRMVKLVMSLASLYKMEVTAEGVETAEQLSFLQTTDCNYTQGYWLSRPIAWSELQDLPPKFQQ
ncbi:putative bifunctional diguanylate cyclase/phosphodiesterase [Teredinibacter waterburyi]|uniref:putative bifunctional diguanylate cyclase/phosphodiesterase n=1 Tax=Teredinibacter waterburyi TaxID=1500538 RepID=UPI00165FF518|nr:bifunctional diguanylate cyclase/phosphodiesterase [Teredinibacter waterburyi]